MQNKRFISKKVNLNEIKDEVCNVPDSIAAKIGSNLHLKPSHPLNTIKTIIERYFIEQYPKITKIPLKSKFEIFDDLSPVVTVNSNFDELLIPPVC